MTQQQYTERRAQLISELIALRKTNKFPRCINHRIRQIAKLDNDYDGTPIEETLKFFGYKPTVCHP